MPTIATDIQALDRSSPGKKSCPDFPLSLKVRAFTVILSRDNWPETGVEVVQVMLNLSLDGGLTWNNPTKGATQHFPFGFGARGGDAGLDKSGKPVTESSITISEVPEPENPNRVLRIEVDNKVQFSTAIKVVEIFD